MSALPTGGQGKVLLSSSPHSNNLRKSFRFSKTKKASLCIIQLDAVKIEKWLKLDLTGSTRLN
jgi:hypothetical protein